MKVAVTMGDPNGVGPEVVVKALSDARVRALVEPLVIGKASVIRAAVRIAGLDDCHVSVLPDVSGRIVVVEIAAEEEYRMEVGRLSAKAGRLAIEAVKEAVRRCMRGDAEAMVTAPFSKEAVNLAGHAVPGHTELIASLTGSHDYVMMMVSQALRVGVVTGHVPLRDVPSGITRRAVVDKIRSMSGSLKGDFGIRRPRIAVLGLNPHAGDGGVLGREEGDIIGPALDEAAAEGHLVSGPFPADGFFGSQSFRSFDATLAMYHDQGLVPFKAISFGGGVNFTAGLPIVRTSPDHGTAFDIAGRGVASEESLRTALLVAADIARRRAESRGQLVRDADA